MSTYHQNFRSEPIYSGRGPRGRGPRRRSFADPRTALRRRMGAMMMLGLLVAPIVWATRDDGKPVSVAYTGGAAAVVQFDPTGNATTDSTVDSATVVTPDTEQPATSPAPAPQELVTVEQAPESTEETTTVPPCVPYTVQPGDSWFGISERSGAPAGEIAALNGMSLQTNLLVGDDICLPEGATVPPVKTTAAPQTTQAPKCSGEYTVRAGDSWSLIASRYSVSASELASANNKTVRSTLLVGKVICLPPGAKAPASTAPSGGSSGGSSGGASAPSRTYTRAELEQIVRDAWPDELENRAFYVVNRESRWVPNVKNAWPSRENPCCYGLFQVSWIAHKSWMAAYGVTNPNQLLDPAINAKMAYVIYQRAGSWKPWWTASWKPTN